MSKQKPCSYWTKARCTEAAKQFSSRKKFQLDNGGAYLSAWRNGWLDEVCGHMATQMKPPGYWTKVHCAEAAKEFSYRVDFKHGSMTAYNTARKNGWLEEVCRHMEFLVGGFDGDAPATLYYVAIKAGRRTLFKIGITNRALKERFMLDKEKITVLKKWRFKIGAEAARNERIILQHCKDFRYKGPPVLCSGNTELFTANILAFDIQQQKG